MICEWENLPIIKDDSGTHSAIYRSALARLSLERGSLRFSRQVRAPDCPESLTGSEILSTGALHPDPFTTIRAEVNYRVRACTRYAIEENQRIELFIELARGATQSPSVAAFRQMGELMYQSHWSYTECGLGSEATDQIIELVRQHAGDDLLYGAKITGGGAGGTVAVLGSTQGAAAFKKVVAGLVESFARSNPMCLKAVQSAPIALAFSPWRQSHEHRHPNATTADQGHAFLFLAAGTGFLDLGGAGHRGKGS